MIQVLLEEMEIPRDSISTEFALKQIDSTSGQRADIVVWHKDREGKEYALLVLELKAKHIELTDHTLEQVKTYNEILKAKYIGIANGKLVKLYEVQGKKTIPLINELYTYSELVKGKVEYTSFHPLQRLSYDLTTYDRYVHHLRKEGYIGEGTPVELHSFLSELQNFLLSGKIHLTRQYKSTIIEDLSYGVFSFGNASGGSFPGYYRSFIVKDLEGKFEIYRIGMFGTPILVDDPVYGNRAGNTYLTVAKDQTGSSSIILQLNIDQFFSYSKEKDLYKVFHNGRRNGFKNKEVIESVKKVTPDLMLDGEIYLGSLPAHRSITSEDGSDFIERLIEDTCLRAKLAQKRKGSKNKKTTLCR
jgi:hypothetical protein